MKLQFKKTAAVAMAMTMCVSGVAMAADPAPINGETTGSFSTSFGIYSPSLHISVPLKADIEINPMVDPNNTSDKTVKQFYVASNSIDAINASVDKDAKTGIPVNVTVKASITRASDDVVTEYNNFTQDLKSTKKRVNLNLAQATTPAVLSGSGVAMTDTDKTHLLDLSKYTIGTQAQYNSPTNGLYPFIKDETSLPMELCKISGTTGSKFIVFIDEWDALFREAKEEAGLQRDYIQLLRGMFKSSMTDKMIEAAYMTGILPIKKYGTQSAMTDFREYTMLSPKRLAKYTGFTEAEVKRLCEDYDMDFEETKRWYDGYSFHGTESIYNPNAIVQAMENREFGSYWTETETYESLKVYIDLDLDGLKEGILSMLGGARCPVDTRTFQNDMTSISSKDDVLTLLVHLGYLAYEADTKSVYIPNEEIRQEFMRAVKYGRHREIAELIVASDRLLQDTLRMDSEKVGVTVERVHDMLAAPIFYNNEQALRSVIRFAYISCMDEFKEIHELPSGIGYADVVYLPKKNSLMPIMVIELKWNKGAESAIEQIKERKYPQVFEGYGSDILLVGISYDEKTKKHECLIEKYRH